MSSIFNNHKIGNLYSITHRNNKIDTGWKLAYYPVNGTYENGIWIDFDRPRALLEKPLKEGIDFREVPEVFISKCN